MNGEVEVFIHSFLTSVVRGCQLYTPADTLLAKYPHSFDKTLNGPLWRTARSLPWQSHLHSVSTGSQVNHETYSEIPAGFGNSKVITFAGVSGHRGAVGTEQVAFGFPQSLHKDSSVKQTVQAARTANPFLFHVPRAQISLLTDALKETRQLDQCSGRPW
jgi:hypothetical protein